MPLSQAELANTIPNILDIVPVEFAKQYSLYELPEWPFSGDQIARIKQAWKQNQCLASVNNGKTICTLEVEHMGAHNY